MSAGDASIQTVSLSGPMTLYESSDARDKLLSVLGRKQPTRIDLEMSGPWHLAGLQLLIAAVAYGAKHGFEVRLTQVPGVCSSVADRAGLRDWLLSVSDSFL